jgi:hypothetical protein
MPAAPAADPPLLSTPSQPAATRDHRAVSAARSSGATPPTPLAFAAPSHELAASFFLPALPIGVARPSAPRAHAAPPVTRATPVRERDRRGGKGGGNRPDPFAPDPTTPLVASGSSAGSSGFVLLLLMALVAAVTLFDPAGLGQRVAAAVTSGVDRIARRIDRPG